MINNSNSNTNSNNILNSGSQRTKGADAQQSNIYAAKTIANMIKSTLGPMGMDKMLIDSFGNTVITNDGVKILKEMQVEHPAAQMLVDVAKTQEAEVGDGTTSAVILSGELLERAEILLKQKIHPTNIVRFYKIASNKSLEFLDKLSTKIDTNDEKILRQICETAITGKVAETSKNTLSKIIFQAVKLVETNQGILKDRIKIQKAVGGNIEDSFIVEGIVLDKKFSNINMPQKKENSKILLIDFPLEVREIDTNANVNINSVTEYEEFLESEKNYLKSLVYKIKEIGVDTIICQKGIDDSISYFLAKENIQAIRRAPRKDMEKLSFALNKKIISSYDDILEENLAVAGLVEKKEILGEEYIFVEKCSNPKAITIFLKSSTIHTLDELQRAVEDALGDLNSILKSKKIVAGGGAIEIELYRNLIKFSEQFSGKEQLVIKEFSKSFLAIPKTLCENCGFDEIETITKLISNHKDKKTNSGLDGLVGIVDDTLKIGIIEPINVKSQAIKSATEITSMILRIDDIIVAKKLTESEGFNI